MLEQPPSEAGLAAYWHLLKADSPCASAKPLQAEAELDAAVRSTPPPPDGEIVEVRVPLQLDRKKFDEAIASVEASRLDGPAKLLWAARARLAQIAGLPVGAERFAAETDLFRRIGRCGRGRLPNRGGHFWSWPKPQSLPMPSIHLRSGMPWRPPLRRPAIRQERPPKWRPPPRSQAPLVSQTRRQLINFVAADFCFRPVS